MPKLILFCSLCLFRLVVSGQKTIDFYLESAIHNSPVFTENVALSGALALDSMLIKAALRPQSNFTSNDYFAPVVNGYGYDEIITNRGNYNALLGVNLAIVGKNNLGNQYAGLNIQKQILENNSKLSERDLRQNVIAEYITVYGEQQLLSNATEVLDILKNEDVLLKDLAEKGQARQTDYLSFLVGYKQQQLSYSQQKQQMRSDLFLLNYLCGIADTGVVTLSDPALSIAAKNGVETTAAYRQILLDSARLQNSLDKIRYNYHPKLNVYGDAGYNTTFMYMAQKNFGAGIGLNFSVPVYDGNERKLQADKIRLSENSRLFKTELVRKQYSIRQLQLRQQISETEELVGEANEQLKFSKTLLTANNKLLESGDVKIADYFMSLRNYVGSLVTVQQLLTSKMQLINLLNALNY
jgi:outer membrane protein TolC